MDDTVANPFLEDLFVDQPTNLPGAGRIHHGVFAEVREAVESLLPYGGHPADPGLGRLFLVTAPEAGYGKSHLVARLRDQLGSVASTLFLPFDRSRPATWPVALSSTLRQLSTLSRSRHLPMSLLEELSRFFLARLVLGGLGSGALKRRDCPEEPARIEAEYTTLLSPLSESKLLPWLDRRASDVAQASDPELPRRLGMGMAELGFWTRVSIDLNLREEGALDRLRGLSNGEARERLLQLLRIATLHRPVMLVADGLDGFHRSDTAGMEIAEIVNGIREKVPRSVTLVCVNDDIWSSVFAGELPSAWRDRLDGEPLRLHSIGTDAAMELVKFRLHRTRLSEAAASCFARRVAEEHRWSDGETPLSPRKALRQAGDLWRREAARYFEDPAEEEDAMPTAPQTGDRSIGHADTFAAPRLEEPVSPPPPVETPPPLPDTPVSSPPSAMPAPQARDMDLAGIDSIINDIRGTGKTVVSESPEQRFGEEPVPPLAPSPVAPAPAPAPAPVPMSAPAPSAVEPTPIPSSFFADFAATAQTSAPVAAPPLTRAALEQTLAQRERDLLSGSPLTLDLERIGRFIRAVGAKHPALGQQEERYPSSRTICLRWSARGHSVLTGFESPRNVYFWNNLLQQSLASNRYEKIAAFSHASEPFDPSLFASFGFSPAVIQGRIDIIGMNDRELAMIYAAERALRDYEGTPEAEKAMQLVTLHLDPLWRRMIQPL